MNILFSHLNLAAGWSQLSTNQTQQSCFACATGPHDCDDFAARNTQINAIKNRSAISFEVHLGNFDEVIIHVSIAPYFNGSLGEEPVGASGTIIQKMIYIMTKRPTPNSDNNMNKRRTQVGSRLK